MLSLEEIRKREADPQTAKDGEARARNIHKALDRTAVSRAIDKAIEDPTPRGTVFWLYQATDQLKKAATGSAPCGNQCSHCCNQPVLITDYEASVIAEYTKRQHGSPAPVSHSNPAYIGVPCVFLKDDKCSVYDVRPFACRVHYSVDKDAELCVYRPGETVHAMFFDNRDWYEMYFDLLGAFGMPHIADIRDWFPIR